MKKLVKMAAMAAVLFSVILVSCEKTGSPADGGQKVNERVLASFEQKFPGAVNVQWNSKSGYWVASFDLPVKSAGGSNSAWFDNEGTWKMTEREIPFEQLPEAVKQAFASSEYAGWTVDEVEVIEREKVTDLYVIEAEQELNGEEKEAELYYSAEGVLVKVLLESDVDDDYSDMITLYPEVIEAVMELYPGAVVTEADFEHNVYEAEIILEGRKKDVYLDSSLSWIMTESEVVKAEVPDVVLSVLEGSEYADYRIDDIKFIETPSGNYYLFDLEKGNVEAELKIAEDGTVLG